MKEKTIKELIIKGDYSTIYLKQYLQIDGFALDTFRRRLKWLLTGKVGTYVYKKGKTKIVTSKKN